MSTQRVRIGGDGGLGGLVSTERIDPATNTATPLIVARGGPATQPKGGNTMTKLLIISVASVSAALALVGAAAADGPVIQTSTLTATNVPWGPTCGNEPIMASFVADRRIESFYDGSVLVLQRRHNNGSGTFTLPSTGVSVPYEFHTTLAIDFPSQTATVTGHLAVVIPGEGVLYRDAGRLVQDISQFPPAILSVAGPHGLLDPGATDTLCAALGA